MPWISRLPADLEDTEFLCKRQARAERDHANWISVYQEGYRYAAPTQDTMVPYAPGQEKANRLYDSTLQELTYEAANTMCAILFPPWTRWMELAASEARLAALPDAEAQAIRSGLQKATRIFFEALNHSNFSSVIHESAINLLIGTCALDFDEGESNEKPFRFKTVPLGALQLEAGPDDTIETTWTPRKPQAQHLTRLFPQMDIFDLPAELQDTIRTEPTKEIEIVQGHIYYPQNKRYYGVVLLKATKEIIWRFDYGPSCSRIVARATKVGDETFGRGRVLLALSDARTLDKMVEFQLRHAALQIAPPMTGVSDGVLNPYTARLQPNTVLPVASNDNGDPSLRVLDIGGNFDISFEMISALRDKLRRVMLGPDMSEGPIKTATEISISDRNRLWAMNGEYSRIQAELLAKVVARGVYILQRRGLIPEFRIDGQLISITYTSPFARSQKSEDLMALQTTLSLAGSLGPEQLNMRLATEKMPAWIGRNAGLDEDLIRTPDEVRAMEQKVAQVAQQAAQAGEVPEGV